MLYPPELRERVYALDLPATSDPGNVLEADAAAMKRLAAIAVSCAALVVFAFARCGGDDLTFPGAAAPTATASATPTPKARSAAACQECDIDGCCGDHLGVESCTGAGDAVRCADGSDDTSCTC